MPPCRTTLLTRPRPSSHSLAMIASASSDAFFCCASKSGGTYSASITGVIGITLSNRTVPPDSRTILQAVAIARLASSVSARSTGTRILLNMAHPPGGKLTTRRASGRSWLSSRGRNAHFSGGIFRRLAGDEIAGEVADCRLGERRKRQRACDLDRRQAESGGEKPVQHALAEPRRDLRGHAMAEHLLDQAVARGHSAGHRQVGDGEPQEPHQAQRPGPGAVKIGQPADQDN